MNNTIRSDTNSSFKKRRRLTQIENCRANYDKLLKQFGWPQKSLEGIFKKRGRKNIEHRDVFRSLQGRRRKTNEETQTSDF